MTIRRPDVFGFTPDLEEFRRLSGRFSLIPVELKVMGDGFSPITLYQSIRERSRYSVLLESVEGGEVSARYSFLAYQPREVFGSQKGEPFVSRGDEPLERGPSDPFQLLRELGRPGTSPILPGLPPFVGGAVGYVGYDAVAGLGDVTLRAKPSLPVPEVFFLTFDRVIAFDHRLQTLSLILNVPGSSVSRLSPDQVYRAAQEELENLYRGLLAVHPLPTLAVPKRSSTLPSGMRSAFDQKDYEDGVRKMKEYIKAGDIFQGVLSRRLVMPITSVDPLSIYRVLRHLNPSPYMFLLEFGSFQVIGASPESLVRFKDGRVDVRPIAGTRPRGRDEDEDRRLADELLADPKERAEHIMLVDLGRNDVGRVAVPGSVQVNEMMAVERYSHVMHLVSRVTGKVRPGLDAVEVFTSGYPAGTVTGAPKIRAMQIVDELEPEGRGIYSGGIGYFSFNGQMDSCIAIRTLVLHEGAAYIQAGAGIVYDSEPEKEFLETVSKSQSLIQTVRFLAPQGG